MRRFTRASGGAHLGLVVLLVPFAVRVLRGLLPGRTELLRPRLHALLALLALLGCVQLLRLGVVVVPATGRGDGADDEQEVVPAPAGLAGDVVRLGGVRGLRGVWNGRVRSGPLGGRNADERVERAHIALAAELGRRGLTEHAARAAKGVARMDERRALARRTADMVVLFDE